ncbi:MAG: MCE family protein [Bacteroidales bacterium]|nr:MCE family protein [Bacteroidales bacterium]MBN2749895.1 MCE family protein [Bacteroidales bacterium]
METHTHKFKVRLGLFIFGGLALFVFAIFIIGKQKNLFNPVFKLSTTFYNVSGLQVGNNIRFSGINVGTVDKISIVNDSTVRVGMLIRKEIKQFIKTDCEVSIGSEGLIGDRLLVISQSSSDAVMAKEGQHLVSSEPVELDAIIASFQVSAKNAEIITQELANLTLKVNSGRGTLGRIIYDSTIAQNIGQSIVNFKNASNRFDEVMVLTQKDISDILGSALVSVNSMEVSTQQLEELMVTINSGEGTIGRLVNDSVTAENIDMTIVNIRNTTKGLDENMQALKHNIFFRRYFKKMAKEKEKKRIEEEARKAAQPSTVIGPE